MSSDEVRIRTLGKLQFTPQLMQAEFYGVPQLEKAIESILVSFNDKGSKDSNELDGKISLCEVEYSEDEVVVDNNEIVIGSICAEKDVY